MELDGSNIKLLAAKQRELQQKREPLQREFANLFPHADSD
jgi:hypothetical protein